MNFGGANATGLPHFTAAEGAARSMAKPQRILVIDDDPDQQDILRAALEDYFGAGVVDVASGVVAGCGKEPGNYDLIFCDYNLPDGTAADVLNSIREQNNTPFVVVTGENSVRLTQQLIGMGADDYVVKIGQYVQTLPLVAEKNLALSRLKREHEQMRNQLQAQNIQLEQLAAELSRTAATDALTGIYNRRHFSKVLTEQFEQAVRYGHDLSCVMMDMDGFKKVNDTLGHQLGDRMLVEAAGAMGDTLRKSDIAARYGGDEFVLLLPNTPESAATQAAARIATLFQSRAASVLRTLPMATTASIQTLTELTARLGLSAGVASLFTTRAASAADLVALADGALYRAKQFPVAQPDSTGARLPRVAVYPGALGAMSKTKSA